MELLQGVIEWRTMKYRTRLFSTAIVIGTGLLYIVLFAEISSYDSCKKNCDTRSHNSTKVDTIIKYSQTCSKGRLMVILWIKAKV